MSSRNEVVKLATSWLGKNEADGSYKVIIDTYNSYTGAFPRGTKMQYGWAWCAATWSAIAIKLGYTDVMPIEISCPYIIERAKQMGCWVENDGYVPKPGDACLYDWQDSGVGDNTGVADHIGIIDYVNTSAGYFTVIEGNYSKAVKKRTVSINGRYIRGFIAPKYTDQAVSTPTLVTASISKKSVETIAREVISGQWGSGNDRKARLSAAGYNYDEVQTKVNQILNGSAAKPVATTTVAQTSVSKKVVASCSAKKFDKSIAGTYTVTAKDGLYVRNDAGTNKKALCLAPYGTKVECYGYYNEANGVRWPYIQFTMGGVQYTGFSSSQYLKR